RAPVGVCSARDPIVAADLADVVRRTAMVVVSIPEQTMACCPVRRCYCDVFFLPIALSPAREHRRRATTLGDGERGDPSAQSHAASRSRRRCGGSRHLCRLVVCRPAMAYGIQPLAAALSRAGTLGAIASVEQGVHTIRWPRIHSVRTWITDPRLRVH